MDCAMVAVVPVLPVGYGVIREPDYRLRDGSGGIRLADLLRQVASKLKLKETNQQPTG